MQSKAISFKGQKVINSNSRDAVEAYKSLVK